MGKPYRYRKDGSNPKGKRYRCILMSEVCGRECKVYSRIVGYFRPVQIWNNGKFEEYKERVPYDEKKTLNSKVSINGKETRKHR